jgi:dihydroorotase
MSVNKLIIENIKILDGKGGEPYIGSIVCGEGTSSQTSPYGVSVILGEVPESNATHIDGTNLTAAPGLIDLHVHFRDPGFTSKEDIHTGSAAAASGGFTTVCCMPNTSPAIHDEEVLKYIDDKAKSAGLVNLFAITAMTKNQKGDELVDFADMDSTDTLCRKLTGHGVAGISEDGKSLLDLDKMKEVLMQTKALGLLVMDHAEDSSLSGGAMNLGMFSKRLGVKGIPAEAEERIVDRDIKLAEELDTRIHIQHVSTAGAVELIREAKQRGVKVSCETAPHYFSFTDEDVETLGTLAKMNPPLRTYEDKRAIIEGLADGTIDIIATDHAPHEMSEKAKSLTEAPFGISGLETAFAASYTNLVKPGYLTLPKLISKMSTKPAELIGLKRGVIADGEAADIVIFDENSETKIQSKNFKSKGKNTPYEGRTLQSRVMYTIRNGEITYE